MIRALLLTFLLTATCLAYGQRMPRKLADPKTGKPMLVGKCTTCSLKKKDFRQWFQQEYKSYQVDNKTLDQLNGQWRDVTILIVLGTWCGDSRQEVPRFLKILDYCKFNKKKLTMVCVDRGKQAPGFELKDLDIQYVPTMIVYRGGAEMGRIIEHPARSLEKDLYQFVGLAEGRPGKK